MEIVLLDPPGLIPTWPQDLPDWPYLQAIDEALTCRDIPPGTVRADHTGRERGERMYIVLAWDVSRTPPDPAAYACTGVRRPAGPTP
ncbi:hypothetical protein [Streptomyces sp. NPDC059378]|uniref:hypothetical protein n=1 Tax=Streptomyces sp. NPDC059378 TaxID=3346815 RepID=UPI003685E984